MISYQILVKFKKYFPSALVLHPGTRHCGKVDEPMSDLPFVCTQVLATVSIEIKSCWIPSVMPVLLVGTRKAHPLPTYGFLRREIVGIREKGG